MDRHAPPQPARADGRRPILTEQLASPLLDGLASYLVAPFAFFGHSMGALIAFELARRMRPRGVQPVHLFAAGCRAPHLPSRSDWHTRPDREFIATIAELGGIPPELLAEREFLNAMLPTLRGECALAETYRAPAAHSFMPYLVDPAHLAAARLCMRRASAPGADG